MQHKRLVSAIEKRGGVVENDRARHFIARNPETNEVLDWYASPGYPNENILVVDTVWSRHPDTDCQTDLFMDTYYKTIRDSVEALGL